MRYSLEFLCWVNRCLFPGDFVDDLIKHGMDRSKASFIVGSMKNLNILDFYQNYCLNDGEASWIIRAVLKDMMKRYLK
jgi:hypothetical protein